MAQPQLVQDMDVDVENVIMKVQIDAVSVILSDVREVVQTFAMNCNEIQRLQEILEDPEHLQDVQAYYIDPSIIVQEKIAEVRNAMNENVTRFRQFLVLFMDSMFSNITNIDKILNHILFIFAIWKHERLRVANNIPGVNFTTPLEKIVTWCGDLSSTIWAFYGKLKEAERILVEGLITIEESHQNVNLIQNWAAYFLQMLNRLLNECFIVEEQPRNIKGNQGFEKDVVVSLLIGRRFLDLSLKSAVTATILISKGKEFQFWTINDKQITLTNAELPMEDKLGAKFSVSFENLVLNLPKGINRKENAPDLLVTETKYCLRFDCEVTLETVLFQLSTQSLPVVVATNTSQDPLAAATIVWDNAFAEFGRLGFEVPSDAPWPEVAQIMNAMFFQATNRGLTDQNLEFLRQKIFGTGQPQAENRVTWKQLCKDKIPGTRFSRWAWFYAAFDIIEKEQETHLRSVWEGGLVHGFISRADAENLIAGSPEETFLLRFSDTIPGAISIVARKFNRIHHLGPYNKSDLTAKHLGRLIQEIVDVKYLFQSNGPPLHKNDAFGRFYEAQPVANNQRTVSGYNWPTVVQTIPIAV